jgi:aminoglycoside phosphotransferase (APT) family kinase protein
MRPHELEILAQRHVPGEGEVQLQLLGTGLANETYRVLRGGSAYALRVAANPRSLGVDRQWEARVLENAAAADLAPPLVYCDPNLGILISPWVEGRQWNAEDVRRPLNVVRMADLIRRVHALALPAPARVMSPAGWIDYYAGGASHIAADLRGAAGEQLAGLAALPCTDPVMCHSDLHTLNLIDSGRSLILLDWEYAHAADPMWDLAAWSANNDLERELQHDLLAAYAGRLPTQAEQQRLRRLGWLYDYVCLLWSQLYLNLRSDGRQQGAAPEGEALREGEAVREGVAARARLLAARLDASK